MNRSSGIRRSRMENKKNELITSEFITSSSVEEENESVDLSPSESSSKSMNNSIANYDSPRELGTSEEYPLQTIPPSTRLCRRLQQLHKLMLSQDKEIDFEPRVNGLLELNERQLEHRIRELENNYFKYSLDEAREMQRGHQLKILATLKTSSQSN